MEWWVILLILIVYFVFEFINAIFFNWRLMLLSEKKYNAAGVFAAISTVMLVSSVILAAMVGTQDSVTGDVSVAWWIIPAVALSMGVGNFFAALSVPKIRSFLSRNKENSKEQNE